MSRGILLIVVFYGLAYVLNLRTVTWVLNNVLTIGFTAAVVIFQPELRRTLERNGPDHGLGRDGCSAIAGPTRHCAASGKARWGPSVTRPSSFPIPAPVP